MSQLTLYNAVLRTVTIRIGPTDGQYTDGRSAIVGDLPAAASAQAGAPVAAASRTEARWSGSTVAHIRPCCPPSAELRRTGGWSFGHSRAPGRSASAPGRQSNFSQ